MPDIFKQYEDQLAAKQNQQPEIDAEQKTQHEDFLDYPTTREESQPLQNQDPEGGNFQSDIVTGDPRETERVQNSMYSNSELGAISTKNTRNLETDPNSWSTEYTMKPFLDEAGTSIVRGIGNHVLKGTGDMLQVASSYAGFDISKGNMISRALQESGEALAQDYRSYIPEELLHENLDFKSMINPKFWSTHVAEMIPQLAEFILLSKGGAGLAKAGAKKLLKNKGVASAAKKIGLGEASASTVGAGKTASKVFGSGKGVMGKLITDQGLTQGASTGFGAVGGGITSNFMAGLLNSAQVVNDHKDDKDDNGNLIFSEEDLSKMASGTMRNNANWLLFDMASFGMTFGGGWKALKGMNPVAKGGKLFDAAQRGKVASKMFQYDIAPIVKNVARLSGKAGLEGYEETFQETYEEWAAQKAFSDVSGEPMKHKTFMDFYNSEENKGTKTLSFAVGALGGAAFNLSTLVNEKADENLKLYNRIENFKKITDKNGTEEELNWQDYHIRQQIADIVIDDKIGLYEDFSNKLVENGNITEEEKAGYDEMVENFQEVKAKSKRLNVKGTSALLYNTAKESYFDTKIEEYQSLAEEQIEAFKELEKSTDKQQVIEAQKKIRETEQVFEKRLKALSILRAEAIQNKENLILGKKANPLEVDLILDEYGNEMVIGGLSSQDYNKYTNNKVSKGQKAADSAKGFVGSAKNAAKNAGTMAQQEAENRGFKMPSMSNLTQKGKDMVNKVMEQFKKTSEVETEQETETENKNENQTQNNPKNEKASGTTNINSQDFQTPKTEQEAQQEAEKVEKEVEIDPNEVVNDEVYNAFKKDGQLDLKTIQDIATAIREKGKLSTRQDEIRNDNKDAVTREIVKQLLNTSKDPDTETATKAPNPRGVNEDSKNNPETETVEDTEEEQEEELDDDDLNDKEKSFIKGILKIEKIGKTIGDVGKRKLAKAKELYKLSKKKTENAENEIGSDRVAGNKKEQSISLKNRLQSIFMNDVIQKIRNRKNTDVENLSQNEMDNYLNTISAYNEHGPTELDKMVVVNHQLKRMFPNAETPNEAFIVRNMFQTLGRDALGHAMAGTIFIDSKAWNQDRVFMHELSHIYFNLAKDEPETKQMLRNAIKDKPLLDRVKKMYDHLTYYSIVQPDGSSKKYSKQNILASYEMNGVKPENLEAQLKFDLDRGEIQTVPLNQQMLILEELFVARLEGPLSENFDKIFQPKNEPQRQKDVKKWWGLLRKRGDIIQKDGGVNFMLDKLSEEGVPTGNLKDYILDTFKAVTVGVDVSAEGMDALDFEMSQADRAQLEDIKKRKAAVADNELINIGDVDDSYIIDDIEDDIEDNGVSFFNKDFDTKAKGATRIIKRFGQVYNKAMRARFLKKNQSKQVDYSKVPLFDRDAFEATLYSLAIENKSANEFIKQIENSELREVKAFNSYMQNVHGDDKLNLYNSMHFVFSNAKHIVGFRNTISDTGKYEFVNSLSQLEVHRANRVMSSLRESLNNNSKKWKKFYASTYAIHNGSEDKQDLFNVLEALTPPFGQFNLEKILEQGHVTYKGQSIPIETLVYGFIKKGMIFQKNIYGEDYDKARKAYEDQVKRIPGIANNSFFYYNGVDVPIDLLKSNKPGNFKKFQALPFPGDPAKGIYIYNARPLVEAFINTNRKFSPLSSIKNAQGNMTPVRITNNHLTKEVDNIIEFLTPDSNGKRPTEEEFFDKFSHLAEKNKKRAGRQYVPNLFLQNIYDNIQKGIMPTISQYNGIENISNSTGNLYAGSSALEQGIEDFLIFANTSRNENGTKNNSYLGSMGTFSDSPRKFFMNMPRIKFEDVFSYDDQGKLKFHSKNKGKVISSAQHLYDELFWDGDVAGSRIKFQNKLKDAVRNEVVFMNKNGKELSKINKLKPYFKDNKRLTPEGIEMVSEFVINSIVNGQNVTEVFLPGIKGDDMVKRFKMNSSPIFSVKNPNFKIEPLFFADEIIENSVAGTDSGMYILQEDAEKLQALGKGVFDMNNGFKLLNASIEKDNPNFKGKAAYLKGYTTVIKEGHPMFQAMQNRKDKYNAYHKEKYGTDPSKDLSDGSHNHMVIAIPQSSDKSNFYPEKFIDKKTMEYTDKGAKMTPNYLRDNPTQVDETQDKLYYNKEGDFVGMESYNFGPQQVMDKITYTSNTPVQMINSIIVNAKRNGQLELANEIQQHISNQKQVNLVKILEVIEDHSASGYRELIMREINKEDMNQGQRILLEDNGSLGAPYVNEIVTNQLGQTIRRNGNKLSTPGTLSHQKPDIGIEMAGAEPNKRLKNYQLNGDGSFAPAEMYLPKHMAGKDKYNEANIRAREVLTWDSSAGKTAIDNYTRGLSKEEIKMQTPTQDLNALKFAAIQLAMKRHKVSSTKEAEKFIGRETDKYGVHIGYHVKGDTVIASRVPGHGPASTGVFEVVGFDTSDGNQVMVPSEFNDIIGSDNDGDALFIQAKGTEKNYSEWNKAFDKLTAYWLSPAMTKQITAKMDFEDQTEVVVEKINEQFPKNKDYIMPFSPEQRRIDYNNTMVSKRNVGPVFNTHKMANMLAAYEIAFDKPITIGTTDYTAFKDYAEGNDSRNQQSAILANIILDNAKHGFADDIGIDEHNVNQAILLVNMGVPLVDVGRILNSPAAKLWSEKNRNNNSLFHSKIKKRTITKEIYATLGIKPKSNIDLSIDPKKAHELSQQAAILETFSYLDSMNSEVQTLGKVMGGHKSIHVNPLVLEQQLEDFYEVVNTKKENQILQIDDQFKNNADLKNYKEVAEKTLEHMKRINPVYRTATNKVLSRLKTKIGDIGANEIENISKDFQKFQTSRLLAHNNVSKEYAKDLMNPDSKTSIFNKLKLYLSPIENNIQIDKNQILNSVSAIRNSLLFTKAMNIVGTGNDIYISANASFVNESFNETERVRAQQEFEDLPTEIQDDLILYDLINNGWKGPQSLAPFFGKDTNLLINMASNEALRNNNEKISPAVLEKLEQTIALKQSINPSNPFRKIYLGKKSITSEKVIDEIFKINKEGKLKHESLVNSFEKAGGRYINVWSEKDAPALFEIPDMSEFANEFASEKSMEAKRIRLHEIIKEKIVRIPNDLTYDKIKGRHVPNLDLALIADKSIGDPTKTKDNYEARNYMETLTEATISFEEASAKMKETLLNKQIEVQGMDAVEEFDIPMFEKMGVLSEKEYNIAMEYHPLTHSSIKEKNYAEYLKQKREANELSKTLIPKLDNATQDELLDMYAKYGEQDAYAYSIVMTPIIKKLANHLANDQAKLWEENNVKGQGFDGQDISKMQAYILSGSTIPSNHPASQALAKRLEVEYKNFTAEKSKYMSRMNKITDALYKEKLGYGSKRSIMGTLKRIKDMIFTGQSEIYQKLYGNMVIREEVLDDKGNLTYNFKLRPKGEIEREFKAGIITQAEKDFYDNFRNTTEELMPAKVAKKKKEDYIPHTAMSRLEAFSARGLLGLMVQSKSEDEALGDVKLRYKAPGESSAKLMNFKQIEDTFKKDAVSVHKRNDISRIREYRQLKRKAKDLLKTGKNEDGSKIIHGRVGMETALGFGALNRFVNNRSVKATELPSMDLNKALGDYVHSTLFVNGNENFKGMEKLQGYIDGVLAFNRENNLKNMNIHVQKVWKDYFTKGKRQTSVLGETGDKVINGLTRFNLFYSLGYQANKNTGGLYAVGNILVGKYHNIKDNGGKAWINGELKYWGLDKGLEGGIEGVLARKRRMNKIMKNLNFMEINVYDEVNLEKKSGLDAIFSDLALAPMRYSEKWIQQVHMVGKLTDEEMDRFDAEGNYRENVEPISNERLVELEDSIKASHGRGYQPTDQRAMQMYSWGNMMLQFSKFLPTMIHDRFSKEDINIYGKEHIGSLRAVGKMVRYVYNRPEGFVEYRKNLSPEQKARLDSGLKGMAMSAVIGMAGMAVNSDTANELFWDSNYYFNLDKLENKAIPPAIQTTNNLMNSVF